MTRHCRHCGRVATHKVTQRVTGREWWACGEHASRLLSHDDESLGVIVRRRANGVSIRGP